MSDINTPMGVIVCPQCSLPKLAGVYGYAGPQCQCWHPTPQPTLDVAGKLLQQSEEIRRLRAELAASREREARMRALVGFLLIVARTAGDAREAAGYERGLAEGAARTGLTPAEHDVLAERQRQISAEGWTPEHDDEHDGGELARAAACYAAHAGGAGKISYLWPWAPSWWKPSTPRRDLVKAAALLLAEIERLDRADAASRKTSWLCPNCPTPALCLRIQGCDRDEIAR